MTDIDTDIDTGIDRSRAADVEAEHLSPLARRIGSDEAVVWTKRIVLGLALAFLVGAIGYFVGVRTTRPPSNEVDVGFLRDMTDHHDQAVKLAQIHLGKGQDPVARSFATEVLMFQRQELGRFQNFQDERSVANPDYSLDRETMEWMGMPTPLRSMPGMATEEQIDRLESLTGTAADLEFLTLMQAHHSGGAHMADYAAANAADPAIREMAERMAANQRTEVKEYQALINRLRAQG